MPDDEPDEIHWDSILDRDDLNPLLVAFRDKLADAARAGQWTELFALLDNDGRDFPEMTGVNRVRVRGRTGYAPLHQAAWHGADLGTTQNLLDRGA